jgi:hypothetical protein
MAVVNTGHRQTLGVWMTRAFEGVAELLSADAFHERSGSRALIERVGGRRPSRRVHT